MISYQSCFKFQVAKVTGGAASKLSKIRVVRKSIARVYIVMHQKQKENLRKFYKVSRHFKGVQAVIVVRAIARYVRYVPPHRALFSTGASFLLEFALRQKVTEEIGIHSDFPMQRKRKTKLDFLKWQPCHFPVMAI